MAGTISRGWTLAKISFAMLKKDPEIIVLPFISAIFLGLLWASFIGLFFVTQSIGFFYLLIIPFYLISYFIVIFFNTAVIGCANIRFAGGDPKARDGLRIAAQNIKAIFIWAMIAATVGIVLQALSRKAGTVGRVIISIIGMAWSIATYFVVPVVVYEKIRPWPALKRSVQILRETWGEALIGYLGMGLIFFLLALAGLVPIIAVLGLSMAVGGIGMTAFLIVFGISILYWIILAAMSTAAENILLTAMYRYGTKKSVAGVPKELLANPWGAKSPTIAMLKTIPGVRTTV